MQVAFCNHACRDRSGKRDLQLRRGDHPEGATHACTHMVWYLICPLVDQRFSTSIIFKCCRTKGKITKCPAHACMHDSAFYLSLCGFFQHVTRSRYPKLYAIYKVWWHTSQPCGFFHFRGCARVHHADLEALPAAKTHAEGQFPPGNCCLHACTHVLT